MALVGAEMALVGAEMALSRPEMALSGVEMSLSALLEFRTLCSCEWKMLMIVDGVQWQRGSCFVQARVGV